jgi:hypothetical protein
MYVQIQVNVSILILKDELFKDASSLINRQNNEMKLYRLTALNKAHAVA